jgi:hypothetical protein
MAIAHAPGTGLGPGDTGPFGHLKLGRRTTIAAVVALVVAAVVIPFGLHALDRDGARATPASRVGSTPPTTSQPHQTQHDSALGARADLPSLLPARAPALRAGEQVRVGDVTRGSVRRTPDGWQVVVRWDGRLQPLTTSGPVSLGDGTTWVASSGLVYTRVPTGEPGRFKVYAWQPQGGSAYTAPGLVATALGAVCFNASFTDFGGCATR